MCFFTKYEQLCKEKNLSPTGVAIKLGISRASVTKWRNGAIPTSETLSLLASFFGVSVDYLLNNTDVKNPPNQQDPEDIAKVALFGGNGEVTPEMWQEVKDFVEYVKAKHKKGT